MSELQEIIASTSIHAYNAGYRQGKEEALEVLRRAYESFKKPPVFNYRAELEKLMEEIRK